MYKYITALAITLISFVTLNTLFCGHVLAQSTIEVTADEAIEWFREEGFYRARGRAVVVRGADRVRADVITAYYAAGDTQALTRILAEGNVEMTTNDGQQVARGDRADYDIATGHLILDGDVPVTLTTPDYVITAQHSLNYFQQEGRAEALGGATATDGTNTLNARRLIGYFQADGNQLERLEAIDNVRITTPQDIIIGNRGIYHIGEERAVLDGEVEIRRDGNRLNGDRAYINLATGVSQLVAADGNTQQNGGGRVRAIFVTEE